MKKGIDVSQWQGKIDWENVIKNNHIDFVMLRAGYGKNNIDKYFKYNAKMLNALGIPIGAYWFSYCHNKEMALNEAKYLLSIVSEYSISYPLCFDFEYDSINYCYKKCVYPTKEQVVLWATTFLNEIKRNNYIPMNYTNYDYYKQYFNNLPFDMWFAQWNVSAPIRDCAIWQYTEKGSYNILGNNIDSNISYIDYAKVSNNVGINKPVDDKNYDKVIYDVITGKYGNGEKRKELLEKNGYDYSIIQNLVNKYLNLVDDIISGKYGNGEERKKKVTQSGYNYDLAQAIVNYLLR